MAVLEVARAAVVTPTRARAADRACLARARETGHCVLMASALAGDVVALGRFHQRPDATRDVAMLRRTTGGRAWPLGDGFLRLVLALPHRSALVGDDPFALAPEQVLNRAVRGPMAALEELGVAVRYPGRDVLTVTGRPLAALGLAVEPDGTTLVEMVLAVARDLSLLPPLLDRADPHGVVRTAMIGPDDVTSLARLGHGCTPEYLAAHSARGYAERLGVIPGGEVALTIDEDADDRAWMEARRPDPLHTHHAVQPTQLGVLEAHLALDSNATISDLRLAGDLLAPAATVTALQAGLRGMPLASDALAVAVQRAVSPPDGFVLGVGPLAVVAGTVAAARA